MKLVVWSPTFYSSNDEKAMSDWIDRLPFVECEFTAREIRMKLKRRPSDTQLRELIALFWRYGLSPLTQLAAFRTQKNETWFADKANYWFAAVFGEAVVPSHEQLEEEANQVFNLISGKRPTTVWRHRPGELGIEFEDGRRLFVDAVGTGGLELSVT